MKNPFRYLLSLMFVLLLGSSFASGTLIGGFDVGPGGDPQVIPFHNFAGNTWLGKQVYSRQDWENAKAVDIANQS